LQEKIKELIQGAISDAMVIVNDPQHDGVHLEAVVVSAEFEGKNLVAQHRMVMAPLKDAFDDTSLHALALRTMTPEKWENR